MDKVKFDLSILRQITTHAASKGWSRSSMKGVLVESSVDLKVKKLVATDGHRLAVYERPLDDGDGNVKTIIPVWSIKALPRTKSCFAEISESRVSVVSNMYESETETSVKFMPMDANFPPYKDVIPKIPDKGPIFKFPVVSLNQSFIADAMRLVLEDRDGWLGDLASFTIYCNGYDRPVTIKTKNLTIVIMPILCENPILGQYKETVEKLKEARLIS